MHPLQTSGQPWRALWQRGRRGRMKRAGLTRSWRQEGRRPPEVESPCPWERRNRKSWTGHNYVDADEDQSQLPVNFLHSGQVHLWGCSVLMDGRPVSLFHLPGISWSSSHHMSHLTISASLSPTRSLSLPKNSNGAQVSQSLTKKWVFWSYSTWTNLLRISNCLLYLWKGAERMSPSSLQQPIITGTFSIFPAFTAS